MGPSVPTCRRTRPSQEALFVFIMLHFVFICFGLFWSFCFFGGIFCISVLSCSFSPLFLNIFLFLFLTVSHLLWWAELHSEAVLMIYKLHLNFSIWYKLRMERSCLTAARPHVSAQILWSVLQHKAWWESITEACDARFIFSQQSFIDLIWFGCNIKENQNQNVFWSGLVWQTICIIRTSLRGTEICDSPMINVTIATKSLTLKEERY